MEFVYKMKKNIESGTQLVFYPFFHGLFWNSIGKIRVIWMQTGWGQLGSTNACKMMHDDILPNRNTNCPAQYGRACVCVCVWICNPLEIYGWHLDFHYSLQLHLKVASFGASVASKRLQRFKILSKAGINNKNHKRSNKAEDGKKNESVKIMDKLWPHKLLGAL